MKQFPPAYAWLPQVEGLPRVLREALALYGELETPGSADNPAILGWAREAGLEDVYVHDAIPWCGLFAAVVCKRAGKRIVDGPLWALSWKRWGVAAETPCLGDILVFSRRGGGHVGFYVGHESTGGLHVLGGNQADAVSIARFQRERLVAIRRPVYRVRPAGANSVLVAAGGAPFSASEA